MIWNMFALAKQTCCNVPVCTATRARALTHVHAYTRTPSDQSQLMVWVVVCLCQAYRTDSCKTVEQRCFISLLNITFSVFFKLCIVFLKIVRTHTILKWPRNLDNPRSSKWQSMPGVLVTIIKDSELMLIYLDDASPWNDSSTSPYSWCLHYCTVVL